MIPITENTILAVAALIYNEAYNQDPDTGWLAGDEHSAPGHERQWLEWSAQLIQALQQQPNANDEQVLALATSKVDWRKVGSGWDIIPMDQDSYSTITSETAPVMPLVRDFLEEPYKYVEVRFLERDPAYQAYLDAPI
jgi:pullulanase/glycogen debranching enzyme